MVGPKVLSRKRSSSFVREQDPIYVLGALLGFSCIEKLCYGLETHSSLWRNTRRETGVEIAVRREHIWKEKRTKGLRVLARRIKVVPRWKQPSARMCSRAVHGLGSACGQDRAREFSQRSRFHASSCEPTRFLRSGKIRFPPSRRRRLLRALEPLLQITSKSAAVYRIVLLPNIYEHVPPCLRDHLVVFFFWRNSRII